MKWPTLALALACVILAGLVVKDCRGRVRLTADIARRDTTITRLTRQRDSLARAYRVDTLHTDSIIDHWHVVTRAGAPGPTDTVTIRDTQPIRLDTFPRVRQIIRTGDSVVAACRQERQDCAALVATERARADTALANERALKRLLRGPLLSGVVGAYRRVDSAGLLLSGDVIVGRKIAADVRADISLPGGDPRVFVGLRYRF